MMETIEVVLGIDIGGTNTKFGLVDRQAKVYFNESISTRAKKPAQELFSRLFVQLDELTGNRPEKFKLMGIGIGAPNGNYFTGGIENPPNLNWGAVNLVDLIHAFRREPAVLTNDANAAALGEMKFGAAREMINFIEITLGTGLGSGIVVNGQVVYGHDGFAGEMGHVIVEKNGRLCGCGRRGCLETYVSAPGICRTVLELMADSSMESELRQTPASQLSSKNIYQAAVNGDSLALDAFEKTGRILGEALADAVSYFSPEAVILYGGLAESGDLLFKPAKAHLELNVLPIFRNKVKLLPSLLPHGEAAVLGAAALMWNELNHHAEHK
jgi:glucokinase